MSVINDKLNSLSKSKFRNSFHLRKYMLEYIDNKGKLLFTENKGNIWRS